MKPVSKLIALVILTSSFFTGNAQNTANLPYTAAYSSQFEMGNPQLAAMVLKAWKAYDDNMLDNVGNYVADTMMATLADGTVLKGKDNFINAIKGYRNGFTAVKDEVIAYMPVRSIDRKDDIVLIWGRETDTKNDGSTQKVDVHEIWAFNKDGKLVEFQQFVSPVKDTK